MTCVVIRDLEKFPGLQSVSTILLYPGSHNTKRLLSTNFNMKDLKEASFVLGIEIIGIDLETSLGYLKEPISIVC